MNNGNTLGEICAGIGGFSVGFEQAGWQTAWQIELDDVNRAVLADRFPRARQYRDLRDWRRFALCWARCIAFGFPCQDISISGNSRRDKSRSGLAGDRSGLFHEIMEIVRFIRPEWLVIENVPQLLTTNDCKDFETVIAKLADCGYVGYARVLDAQYFGVPQKRRRLFLVAGFGKQPSLDFLADANPVESLPCAISSVEGIRPGDCWAGYTLGSPTNSTAKIPESLWAVNFSLLTRTDGIRCLSGRERLSYMGFDADWMSPALNKLMLRETPCPPPSHDGLLKF